ncbi:hypothetical protein G3578_14730 [Brevibacillus sp. SYP-B805]|uniref:hypothetical protein n=1 Tax=Brevibacillus sp. SYP-B805 TaxID=1578199 RepID=UPI0013E9FE6F|nr:hypothetical protein [Brevibacillus sp. SYP-B805]NGQ96416.1 hypothetical protein [Brevibacillus sp. SYP-B805]
MKLSLIFIVVTCLFLLSGCSEQMNSPHIQPGNSTRSTSYQSKMTNETSTKDILSEVGLIKQHLKIGITKSRILNEFNNYNIQVVKDLENNEIYRIDIISKTGYKFYNEDKFDSIDIQGLQNDNMRVQIFLSFSEDNLLESYSLYYCDENKIIHGYHLFENGESKEDIITL